ncbi:biliverdin-producing heme oxygenase [Poseidonocella pacifica]|nr:biliverdin-producing heme oxygenase [Poseidonocella pacifica]
MSDTTTVGDLRSRLRSDTRDRHETLDQRLFRHDLAERDGLTTFLLTQATALATLLGVVTEGARALETAKDLLARAQSDLRVLGVTASELEQRPAPMSALAFDYVVFGSRLGNTFLRKAWAASVDPQVQTAQSYFTAPDGLDGWRFFARSMALRPAVGSEADATVADAARAFLIYHDALDGAERQMERAYAST